MIKSILKLGVFLLIGVLAYNYFLGDDAEKKQAQNIVNSVKGVVVQGFDLLRDEYKKFKAGKYDGAIDRIGNGLSKAKEKGGALVDDIKEWEGRRQIWEEKRAELDQIMESESEDVDKEEVKQKIKDLEKEGKALKKEGQELEEAAEVANE